MTGSIVLPPEIETLRKARGIASVYRTATRILTGENITVSLVNQGNYSVPAWTDGINIYINVSLIDLADFDSIERLHGLVFHETAHVLFSPRKHSKIVKWAMEGGFFRSMNCLEDNRIEHLLTSTYPSTAPWLSMMLARWVLQLSDPELVFPLVAGRKYLPQQIRDAAKGLYHTPARIADIDRVVNRYKELVFPMDYAEAMDLITEFHALVQVPEQLGGGSPWPEGGVCEDNPTQGSPVGGKDQRGWRDSGNGDFEDDDEDLEEEEYDEVDEQDGFGDDSSECECTNCGALFTNRSGGYNR
jgi:hypothetical protein